MKKIFLAFTFLTFISYNNTYAASPTKEQSHIIDKLEYKKLKTKKKGFLKSLFKDILNDPENNDAKKKLPFGVFAFIGLGVIGIGLLIGTGIGNLLIFAGWFAALIFGLKGLKDDKNKFLPLIALAVALLLFLSTITFLDIGIF